VLFRSGLAMNPPELMFASVVVCRAPAWLYSIEQSE